jgi:hypothetical protein
VRVGGIGVALDGLPKAAKAVGIVAALGGEQAERGEGVGVVGIKLERFKAMASAALEMAWVGLIIGAEEDVGLGQSGVGQDEARAAPRASVTLIAPREPVIVKASTLVLAFVRVAPAGTDRVKSPPLRLKVAVVVPGLPTMTAEAGRTVPARKAMAAAAMMKSLRRFMGLSYVSR